jgi:predicted nuclease of predicted toxin-antitoxin system
MKFLADENCDFAVVRALRAAGYDVLAVAELTPRAKDSTVIRIARDDERVLLTEDKDFGQLVYAGGHRTSGVILLRYPAPARGQLAKDVVKFVKKQSESISGGFVVMQPGQIRIRRAPGQ